MTSPPWWDVLVYLTILGVLVWALTERKDKR